MSTVTIRLNKRLLEDLKAYLLSQDITVKESSWSNIVNKALSLYVYGHENHKTGQQILKNYLDSVGATEQDYLRGKVKTWARQSLQMQNSEAADSVEQQDSRSVLQEHLQEVITEVNQSENTLELPNNLIRQEPEPIQAPTTNTDIPPWKRISLVDWNTVLGLYPERNPNPLVNWADNDEIAQYAVRAALAQLPPPSRKGAEAKRLSEELYSMFIEWKEKYEQG